MNKMEWHCRLGRHWVDQNKQPLDWMLVSVGSATDVKWDASLRLLPSWRHNWPTINKKLGLAYSFKAHSVFTSALRLEHLVRFANQKHGGSFVLDRAVSWLQHQKSAPDLPQNVHVKMSPVQVLCPYGNIETLKQFGAVACWREGSVEIMAVSICFQPIKW